MIYLRDKYFRRVFVIERFQHEKLIGCLIVFFRIFFTFIYMAKKKKKKNWYGLIFVKKHFNIRFSVKNDV